jgi:cell division protein FtsQ
VDEVKVTGLHTLDAADVIRASGIEPGQRILWIRLSAATRNVEKIPAVERAVAERSLPGTVVLKITERRPVAKLDTSPDIVTDDLGHLFADANAKGLPSLAGWRTTKSRRHVDGASAAALRAYVAFPQALRVQTRKIIVQPGLVLVMANGTQVRFGRLIDLRTKALAALAVLRAEHGKPVAYVDVRTPSTPVVGAVPTPTPRPTPAPVVAQAPAPTAAPGTAAPTPVR